MVNTQISMSNWEELNERLQCSPLQPAQFARPEYKKIFAYLDTLPEFHRVARSFKKNPGTGRKGYAQTTLLKLFLVMHMEKIPTYAQLCRFLKNTPKIAHLLHLHTEIPDRSTISRNFNKLNPEDLECLKKAALRRFYEEHPEVIDDMIVDGTNFGGYGASHSHTDPEAGWQKKSTAPDVYGYQAVVLVGSQSGLILGSNIQGKGAAEDKNLMQLFFRGKFIVPLNAQFFLGDARYDCREISTYAHDFLALIPIIDYNHRRSPLRCYYQLPATNWRYKYCPREFWFRTPLFKHLRPRVETPFNRLKPQGKYIRSNVRGRVRNENWFSFFVLGYNLAKTIAQEPHSVSWTLEDWVYHLAFLHCIEHTLAFSCSTPFLHQ